MMVIAVSKDFAQGYKHYVNVKVDPLWAFGYAISIVYFSPI